MIIRNPPTSYLNLRDAVSESFNDPKCRIPLCHEDLDDNGLCPVHDQDQIQQQTETEQNAR